MRLGAISDELHDSLEPALAAASEWGVREIELNHLDGNVSIAEASDADLAHAEALLNAGRFKVCCVSTMAFKTLLLDGVREHPREAPEYARHLQWVRRGCEVARRFGAPLVRIFAFRKSGMVGVGNPSPRLPRGGAIPAEVLKHLVAGLRNAAEIAEAAGVDLVVENVRSCWGNSCWNTAEILRAAGHPRLKAVWDPGNDFVAGGDPYPEGYAALRPWIAHVHAKNAELADAATGLTRWQRVGQGALDYRVLLKRLRDDGYAGVVALETHWRGDGLDRLESSRRSFEDLKACFEAAQV